MPITIGSRLESDYTNPLGLLSDCHRRIERFLRILLTVTKQVQGGKLNGDQHKAVEVALRYFSEGAPKHTRDEEESLFPRVRLATDARAQQALALLDELHQEHAVAEAGHREVEILGSRWLAEGRLIPADARALTEMLDQLSAIYQRHIAIEDTEIFPLAAKILGHEEIRALAHEMAARRGLILDARMQPYRPTTVR